MKDINDRDIKVNPNDVPILQFVNSLIEECSNYKTKWYIGDNQMVKKIAKATETKRNRIVQLLNKRYEKGTVIDFPCKVGEIVYLVSPHNHLVLPFKVTALNATELTKSIEFNFSQFYYEVKVDDPFELLFKTYSEAERYLNSLSCGFVKTWDCYEDWLFDRGRKASSENLNAWEFNWRYGGQNFFSSMEKWKDWAHTHCQDTVERYLKDLNMY